ncbi:MAG: hypothetical protein SGJ24_04970, partial [Chloroflexota bacterium]|nr:hypothetical protein [Chloroflexota bacterium]
NGYINEYYDNKRSQSDATPVAVTVGTTTPNINFVLDSNAYLSGTAYRADGTTLVPNAQVRLTHTVTGTYYPVTADASGVFTFGNVEPGTYDLRGQSAADGLVWHDQKPSSTGATVYNLTSGANVTAVSLRFLASGSINGTVTIAGGGGGADDPLAAFYQPRPYLPGSPVVDVEAIDFATQFQAQRGESYSTYLARELAGQTDGGALTDPMTLIAPILTSLTDGESAIPLAWARSANPTPDGMVAPDSVVGGTVTAYLSDPNYYSFATFETTIQAGGTFSFPTVPAGYYRVKVAAPGYVTEYFNDVYTVYESPFARVNGGAALTLNMALDPAGTVTGRVFAPDGVTGLANRLVFWRANNHESTARCTDASGNYTLPDAPTNATFPVGVSGVQDCSGSATPYYDQTYQDGRRQFFPVGVTAMSNVNFTLVNGGTISGKVFRNDGTTPIQSAYVYFYDASYSYQGSAMTAADGSYTSSVLKPGTVKAQIYSSSSGGYAWNDEWYNNATSFDTATAITVTGGANTPNINITTDPAAGGVTPGTGSISGRITLPDGVTGASNGYVTLYRRNSATSLTYLRGVDVGSSSNGSYSFTGLAAGTYAISISFNGYVYEYYANTTNYSGTTPIVVGTTAVTGINESLNGGTLVTGTIFDQNSGAPWDFPSVIIYTSSGSFMGYARSAFDGTYFMYLPAGTYTANASSYPLGAFRFYGGGISLSGAGTFTVGGTPVSGINITLGRWGEIVGRITQTDGTTPIRNRYVFAAPNNVWSSYANCNRTDGYYLNSNAYLDFPNVVHTTRSCGDDGGNFAGEYWQESSTRAGATGVNVNNTRRFASGINFTLGAGGAISGRIFAADGVTPLVNAYTYVYVNEGGGSFEYVGYDQTDGTGAYSVDGLVSDSYAVAASANSYLFEYYNDKTSQATADLVSVTAPNTTPNINFSLAATGSTATLNGTIDLQGRPAKPHARWAVPVRVVVKPTGGGAAVHDATVNTDQNGVFSIAGLAPGSYTVWMKHANMLGASGTATLVVGANAMTAPVLKAGDADNNNVINITDFSILAATFGKSFGTAGYDGRADFNGDAVVNITDFSLLAGSFGQTGAVAP